MDFNSEFEFKLYCFINKCLLSVFCVLLLGTERTNRTVCLLATHRLVGNTNNYHAERCTRRDGSVGWNVQRGSHGTCIGCWDMPDWEGVQIFRGSYWKFKQSSFKF